MGSVVAEPKQNIKLMYSTPGFGAVIGTIPPQIFSFSTRAEIKRLSMVNLNKQTQKNP